MFYRKLGQTGRVVSVIGIGTWQLGGEWGCDYHDPEAAAIFEAAREEGINLIDTAECYGDHTSERLIGQAIARDRERWIVATKFGHHWHGWMDRTDDYSLETMRRQLEDSLRALRTDYIDLYQIHGATTENIHDEALWAALAELRDAGKIRAIGVSCRPEPQFLHRPEFETAQLIYNRLDRSAEAAALPLCQARGLGVLARVPLATGLLSGHYAPGHRFAANDVRAKRDPQVLDEQLHEVERLRREEVPSGTAMALWALAWCLRHPAITAVIPGCRSAAQVHTNADTVRLDIGQSHHPQAVMTPPGFEAAPGSPVDSSLNPVATDDAAS